MVLLIFFFLLLCVALPLGEVTRATLGLTISFTFVDLLVTGGAILWLIQQFFIMKKNPFKKSKTFLAVIGIFLLSLVLNLFTLNESQFLASGLYIVRFFCLGLLFFMVRDSSLQIKKRLQLMLFAGGSLLLASGYMQYFLYPSLRNLIYFGWDEHFYRMFGTFFDPNFFGLFLVVFFLFLLSKIFTVSVQKKYLFVGLLMLSTATFIAIFLSYSRTALFALICGMIILLWNKKFWKWFWIFLIAAVIATAGLFILSTRSKDVNSFFRTTSTDARLGSAKNALTIFLDSPIYGIGFNAYRYAQYRHHFMLGSPIQEDHGASGADSSLLLVLATSGIVGLSIFLLFLWNHVRALLKTQSKLGLATFTAIFVGSFFVNGLFYPFLLVWLWMVLGLTESDEQ